MKSDSERQIKYQSRRMQTEKRVTVWFDDDVLADVDAARGPTSRAAWIRAVVGAAFPAVDELRFMRLRDLVKPHVGQASLGSNQQEIDATLQGIVKTRRDAAVAHAELQDLYERLKASPEKGE